MKSFKQFISEEVTRDELISHYNAKHGGMIDRYPADHKWNENNNYKYSGGFRSHIDNFYPHRLDPTKLATLRGRNDEHIHHFEKDSASNKMYNDVKDSIKAHGFNERDQERGHENGAMIRVFHDGEAKIHEGNKRTRAAAEVGIKTVPVRWEYQGGSARDPKAPHPVDFMHDDDIETLRHEVKAKKC